MRYTGKKFSRPLGSALAAVGVSLVATSPVRADVTVNPDGDLSTDVRHGPGLTLLTNPVADPLDLGADNLFVGNTLKGALEISNGGSVTNGGASIGETLLANGLVRVEGGGSQWINNGTLTVGSAGDGVLQITGGGSVSNGAARVGQGTTSISAVTVDGVGSQWSLTATLRIGVGGDGTVEVTGGGEIDAISNVFVANNASSVGSLLVDGENSRAQGLSIGVAVDDFAMGTVTISNGGVGEFTAALSTLDIGNGNGATGVVSVDGPGSQLLADMAAYRIGQDAGADGTLEITNGAMATGDDAQIAINGTASTSGTVLVDGAGSMWDLSGNITMSQTGGLGPDALLTVSNGGRVSVGGSLLLRTDDGDRPSGVVRLLSGGTLHVGGAFVRVAGQLSMFGGVLELGGDRTFDGLDGVLIESNFNDLDEDSVLTALGGDLSSGQNLRVLGQLNLFVPLVIDGGSLSAGSIPNVAAVDLKQGTLELTSVDVDVTGGGAFGADVLLSTGQRLNVSQTLRVAADGEVLLEGGKLGGGVLENSGLLRGDGEVDSRVVNQAGGEVRAKSADTLRLTGAGNVNRGLMSLVSGGTIESPDGLVNAAAGTISGRGAIHVGELTFSTPAGVPTPEGTGLINEGVMEFSGGFTDVFGDVWAQGGDGSDIITSGESVLTFFDDVYMFDDAGVAGQPEIRAGIDSTVVYFGLVKGDVNQTGLGVHVIEGTLSPGFSPGRVVGVNQTWAAESTLVIDIAGDAPVTDGVSDRSSRHSVVELLGTLTIHDGSTIDVNLIGLDGEGRDGVAFSPSPGDSFEVLHWGTLAADVSAVNFDFADAALAPGLSWRADWGPASGGSLVLQVVPEPGAIALWAVAVAGVTSRKRPR